MSEFVAAIGGALIGAIAALWGAFFLERRRERLHEREIISAVQMESLLLSAAFKTAAVEGILVQSELRKDYWNRYGHELVHYLPSRFIKRLYLLYADEFDAACRAFATGKTGVPNSEAGLIPYYKATMFGWAIRAEKLWELIREHRSKKSWFQPWRSIRRGSKDDGFKELHELLDEMVETRAKEIGLPLDTIAVQAS